MEGVEIMHDPAVPDYDFLKMKFTVVGIKFELIATDWFFIGVSLDKVKQILVVVDLDAEGNDLVD